MINGINFEFPPTLGRWGEVFLCPLLPLLLHPVHDCGEEAQAGKER